MSHTSIYSIRLKDAEPYLEAGAVLAGERRSEFTRQAIRERYRRVRRKARTRSSEKQRE